VPSPLFQERQGDSRLWRFYSPALFLFVPVLVAAQIPVRRDSIAPGVVHLTYQTDTPHSINVLSFDRSRSNHVLEAYRPKGLVSTSVQVRENEGENHLVVAAVNGDFFSFETGMPVGNQVMNGAFVTGSASVRSHMGITGNSRPFIERLSFAGVAAWRGQTVAIDGVNQKRARGMNVLYNVHGGKMLPADSLGVSIKMRLIEGWKVADTVRTIVTGRGGDVRRFDGLSEALLVIDPGVDTGSNPQEGDTIRLFLGFKGDERRYTQVLGGGGRILEEGRIVGDGNQGQEGIRARFFTDRHPRTFVGFDLDTATVFLCTVDGRQASSAGMNFREMGEFLLQIGVWNAVNLDGGGSTTMVVRYTVVNSPSDSTGERPVANSLHLILKEMTDHNHEKSHEN